LIIYIPPIAAVVGAFVAPGILIAEKSHKLPRKVCSKITVGLCLYLLLMPCALALFSIAAALIVALGLPFLAPLILIYCPYFAIKVVYSSLKTFK
jgi:hypothetical protein